MRPGLPPLGWWAVAVFIGVLMAEAVSWRRFADGGPNLAAIVLGTTITASFLVAVVWWLARTRSTGVSLVTVMALGVCVGMASGCTTWARWHAAHTYVTENPVTVLGVVDRDPLPGRDGWSFPMRLAERTSVTARIQLSGGIEPPVAAERVRIDGVIDTVGPADEWARRSHRRGEIGSLRATDVDRLGWSSGAQGRAGPIRSRVRATLARVTGPGGDLLQGILLGDRTRLRGTPVEQDLRICGLSHLLAVSGTHLGILAVLMTWIATRTRRGVRGRVLFVTVSALLYVLMTGVQPSSVRALTMGSMAGLACLSGRRRDGVAALSAAAAGMLVFNPYIAFDIGFRLSVSAVAGLLLFASLATRWTECALGGRGRLFAAPVALTLVAQGATLPVAIPLFQVVSLVSPLANVVAVPLVTVALAVGLVGGLAGLVSLSVGGAVLKVAAWPLVGVSALSRQLAMLPGAAVGVEASATMLGAGALLAGALIWAWWPLPRSRRHARVIVSLAILALVLAASGIPHLGGPALVVLDVGQGDATLVRDGSHAVLIDAGPDPDVLRRALTREGIRSLDAIIFTHDHADHTRGVTGVVGLARVERVFIPAVSDDEAFSSIRQDLVRVVGRRAEDVCPEPLRAGDLFRVGRVTLRVLWPDGPDPLLSTNDTSVVIEVSYGGFSAILTGDAEEEVWRALKQRDALRAVDVLKVPHHGSMNGLTPEALAEWAPRVALISVGQPNDFGHPAPALLELLEQAGITVFRTDHHRSITVDFSKDGFSVGTERDRRFEPAYATIGLAAPTIASHPIPRDQSGDHGFRRPQRPQARLPHPRSGRAPARAGGRPSQEAALRRRRPRLQPRRVRWRERTSRRGDRRRQYASVHVRSSSGDTA